jgi:hypothetical protein
MKKSRSVPSFFLKGCNWRGLFMIELLRDPSENLWFIEFNARAWGSMALARRLGFEYPAFCRDDAWLNCITCHSGTINLESHLSTSRARDIAFVVRPAGLQFEGNCRLALFLDSSRAGLQGLDETNVGITGALTIQRYS